MLRCIFIKRKLYDYLDKSLSDIEMSKVKSHIDGCKKCNESARQLSAILEASSQKNHLEPNAEFWHNFKIDLDRRLNEKLVPAVNFKRSLSYRLRPAFAYLFTLIFVLALGNYFFKSPHSRPLYLAQDDELIDEIDALDELDEAVELDYQDDPYMEELDFLSQFEES